MTVPRGPALVVLSALGLSCLPAALWAQAPARVVGRVTDLVTGAPVAEAEVALDDQQRRTDPSGAFSFGSVRPGRLALRVRAVGYRPAAEPIEVLAGLDREVAVRLEPLPVALDSVVVIAEAGAGELAVAGADLVRRGSSLAQALDGWEGVVVRRTGPGAPAAPQVRGSAPEEVLVLVDGFPVNDPLTGRADLSRLPTRDVERLTLRPGARTARAGGRAIAGVIAVETRSRQPAEVSTWVSSLGAVGGRAGGSLAGLRLALSLERQPGTFSYERPGEEGGGEATRGNVGAEVGTFTAGLDGAVDLRLRAAASRRGLPGTTKNPTRTAEATDRSMFLGVRRGGSLAWSASVEWLETRARDATPPQPFVPYDTYTNGWGASAGAALRGEGRAGGWRVASELSGDVRYDRFGGDVVRSGASFGRGGVGAHLTLSRGTGSRWTLAPSLRVDAWRGRGGLHPSGRVDLSWSRGRTTVEAAVGTAVTAPALIDLLFREGVGIKVNPDLRPERVLWELEAGLRHAGALLGADASASVRLFYGRVADMVLWTPDFRSVWSPGNFDVRRRGGEASLRVRPRPDLAIDGGVTLAAVTYERTGIQVRYRPRTTATAGLAWSPGRWRLDARWHRIGPRHRDNANVLPAIDLLDLGVERRLGAGLLARIEVRDLADQRAEFIAGYPTPGRHLVLSLDLELP